MRKLIAAIITRSHTKTALLTELRHTQDENRLQAAYILYLERQLPAGHLEDRSQWVPVSIPAAEHC